MTSNTIAIIPAYNPQPVLAYIVEELIAKGFKVVVVDDGSLSECASTFHAACRQATLLTHEENRGKGAAIKTGIDHTLATWGNDCVIATVDADGQHDVDDVVRVCEEARKHPEALALGTRSFDGEVPLRSKFGNAVTRIVFRLASGASVRDTQTGLRAFSGRLAPALLHMDGSRYEYEMNVLMECTRNDIPLREVGIRTIYIDDNAASHFDPVRDSARIYREILKFSASSFASFLIDYVLFCALLAITGSPTTSNIAARLASATANYTMNRKAVFASSASIPKSLAQYAALAVFILVCNTLALNVLVTLGANAYIAKVVVELALFVVSYTVQHTFIFGKEKKKYEKTYLGDYV